MDLNEEQRALMASLVPRDAGVSEWETPDASGVDEYALNEMPTMRRVGDIMKLHGVKSVSNDCYQFLSEVVKVHVGNILAAMFKMHEQREDVGR